MINFTFNSQACAETSKYRLLIPDGFKVKTDEEGRDFVAWLPNDMTEDDMYLFSDVTLYASEEVQQHTIPSEILTPTLCSVIISSGFWGHPIQRGCKSSKFIPLNEHYPAGGIMAGYDDNCFYYHALIYFTDSVKMFVAQFSNVESSDAEYCDKLVIHWINTLEQKEKFKQLKQLDDVYFTANMSAALFDEWKMCSDYKFTEINQALNYNLQGRINQAKALLPSGDDTMEAVNADIKSIVQATADSISAFLNTFCVALNKMNSQGCDKKVLAKLLGVLDQTIFDREHIEISIDGGQTTISGSIKNLNTYKQQYDKLLESV